MNPGATSAASTPDHHNLNVTQADAAGAGQPGRGIRLSCRAIPLTNVVMELQEGDRLRRGPGFASPNRVSITATPPGRSLGNPASKNDGKERETQR